jgi:phosphopantetheine--protein transferase-like protein
MVADLPVVKDYWDDSFYSTTFTASEIAYCLMQSNPSMHFAARWCAKEALKKCDAAYQSMDLNHLEVALTTAGAPFLRSIANGTAEPLPVAVSLSHTPHIALAAVVKSSPPTVSNVIPSLHAPKSTLEQEVNTPPVMSMSVPTFLSASALIVALWALACSW